MTGYLPGEHELDAALEALSTVHDLVQQGRAAFDAAHDRRLALAMCWVSVGSQVKQLVRVRGITSAVTELSAPVRMRDKLAYQPLSDLDPEVLWATCVQDGPRLTELLLSLRRAL